MRVYRFATTGGIDDLTLAEAERPKPGRGQVLVRMRAASLNYRDLSVAKGKYRLSSIPPDLIPLSDGAGEVVEAGPEVTRFKRGDRVAGIFMQGWIGGEITVEDRATALGGAIDGVLAEYRLFDQQGLVPLPDHLSFEEGASLPCAAVTAWNALYGAKPLQAGETVLVLGTGGVSIFALQFAHAAGARVIATSSSDEKLQRARDLGAAEGVNYRRHPDWEAEVRRLTGGRGVDHVVEVGGAGTLPRSIASCRLGGWVHLIGVLSGGQMDPTMIMGAGVTVRGIYVGSRQMFEAMNRAIELHRLRPVIDTVFPFDRAHDAYRHLESAAHVGKVVIRID
ncbi:NAD(P)-dependent alcohol dehydrogenase [Azospirillum sp. SYSU D00513]|uniref:zinc-dependent alcohol dehydrogenase family protein n=1 Tax=Azospirillum sp. SYSU D00513 TaxID=2812561 RepID=UPI001A97966C|nr:NAD(P)-dependent alcohol dehydrogenase [Azospirillum sp. SYSU D00513]